MRQLGLTACNTKKHITHNMAPSEAKTQTNAPRPGLIYDRRPQYLSETAIRLHCWEFSVMFLKFNATGKMAPLKYYSGVKIVNHLWTLLFIQEYRRYWTFAGQSLKEEQEMKQRKIKLGSLCVYFELWMEDYILWFSFNCQCHIT